MQPTGRAGPSSSLANIQEPPSITSQCRFRTSPERNRKEEVWGGQWAHRARLRSLIPWDRPQAVPKSPSVERVRARQGTSPKAVGTRMLPVR